ncbi:MAG TPA: TRC40/GET3/ArsA family transport-energizing ATPase [Candidatus Caenarcaniphilales bacterium]|nr:TRC40/GET3/ArsA family transport-energizing ATPase [Candidatus Caenarcaniphilales bacterium]
MTRILLYTGKGGVGKTSVAAATAALCADRGLRTLVVSTDIAHSLADALDQPIGPTPTELAPNLWGHEPDVFFNLSRYWRTIQSYFASLFSWGGLDEVMAEEMTVLPGMDELGNLLWIGDHVDRGQYDVIVVDAAPTGETVRLLSLPEASRWWIEKIAPIGRRVQRLGGPVLRRIVGVPMPNDEVYESAEHLLDRLRYVHDLLANPERSSVRLVLNLEKVSIQEAQRSFTYFHLYGYPTDLIVANRVLPAAVGPYFEAWREAQARYLPLVEEQFAPVPVRTVPFFDHEMVGLPRLRELGHALFGEADPAQFLYRGRPYSVRREAGGYTLTLELPFTSRDEIALSRNADELVLQVGSWRRNLVLPRLLLDAPTEGARMEDRVLKIRFGEPRRAMSGGSRRG